MWHEALDMCVSDKCSQIIINKITTPAETTTPSGSQTLNSFTRSSVGHCSYRRHSAVVLTHHQNTRSLSCKMHKTRILLQNSQLPT